MQALPVNKLLVRPLIEPSKDRVKKKMEENENIVLVENDWTEGTFERKSEFRNYHHSEG